MADNPDAVTLGRALFFSKALSGDGSLSCASCHRPELFYVDGLPRSKGVKETLRNAPTVVGSAFHTWFYWDGRRDSLWSQALIPIESADEMGGNRVDAIRVVKRSPELSRAYRAAFGESPPSLEGLPGANPFGTAEQKRAWAGLGAQVQERVNRVFSNLGKSLASFQRTLRPTPGAFDAYVTSLERGQRSDYSDEARHGLELFIDDEKTRCLRCHNGPLFTNYDFHNIGTGNFDGERLDFGRVFGVRALKLDPFNCLGPYSDAAPEQCSALRFLSPQGHVPLEGAFKVPSLRGVSRTAPYFHDGSKGSLEEVVEHYRRPPAGQHELIPLQLTDAEASALVAFLKTL